MVVKNSAFTLVETLITLAIIGVVAAMTLPTLISNHQKRTYVEGLKVAYSTLNQAMKQAMAADGVDKFYDTTLYQKCQWSLVGSKIITDENGNKIRVNKEGLSDCTAELGKYLKKVEYLGAAEMKNATGSSSNICRKDIMGKYSWYYLNDKTQCTTRRNLSYKILNSMTMDVLFNDNGYRFGTIMIDINEQKGPNTFGRDAFYFAIMEDGSVEPYLSERILEISAKYQDTDFNTSLQQKHWSKVDKCSKTTTENGTACTARVIEEGWQMNY